MADQHGVEPDRIHVHIDRIVLRGLSIPAGRGRRLQDLVQAGLQGELARTESPGTRGPYVAKLQSGRLPLDGTEDDRQVAAELSRTIARAIEASEADR